MHLYNDIQEGFEVSKQITKYQRQIIVFYQMLCNAFADEENQQEPVERIELGIGTDVGEMLVAMMEAMKLLASKLCPGNFEQEDLIDFTHVLNRLAVQHVYGDNGPDVDAEQEDE